MEHIRKFKNMLCDSTNMQTGSLGGIGMVDLANCAEFSWGGWVKGDKNHMVLK